MVVRLGRKEIENYLIDPEVIEKALCVVAEERKRKTGKDPALPSRQAIEAKVEELLNQTEIMNLVRFQVVPKYRESLSREKDASTREQEADAWFLQKWQDKAWRLRNCRGKQILAAMREWVQQSCQLTVTTRALVASIAACPQDVARIAQEVQKHFYPQGT